LYSVDMNNLIIEGTSKTPSISMDAENGIIEIQGNSIPEDPVAFYQPYITWAEKYIAKPCPYTLINIKLEYFNTSSSRQLLNILKKFDELSKSGKSKVTVYWYYQQDDEDMLKAGEELASLLSSPFRISQF